MTFEVRLGANARRDLDRHIAYFQSHDELRQRIQELEDDVLETLEFIRQQPFLRREISPGVRHEALRVFRYHVWYRTYEGADFVDVFAILHQRVDPEQLRER